MKSTPAEDFKEPQFPLIEGEKVVFDDVEETKQSTDEELNLRYVKGDVRIVTESARYSLAGILTMLQETVTNDSAKSTELRYKLDPEYQRRHRWNVERKSRLIESFLMNVPVPPVFLYEADLARYEVMDGRQRLTALSDFYANKFALKGLQYWPELDGRTYSTLPSKVRDGIDRRYISSIILLKETAATEEKAAALKKMVFERLNSGGVRLSSQETRNAVFDGPLNQLCLQLSADDKFRAMWRLPASPPEDESESADPEELDASTEEGRRLFEKMEDVELVLRFFAYRQIRSFPAGLNRISAFLDRFLREGNQFDKSVLEAYQELFLSTVSFVHDVLGVNGFARLGGKGSTRPTKIVYDPIMYVAGQYGQRPDRERWLQGREVVVDLLTKMFAEQSELFSGRRTNAADVEARNQQVAAVFNGAADQLQA
ncbi:MAG: DUF262 domain-containing protein [Acidobacteriota bacterium]